MGERKGPRASVRGGEVVIVLPVDGEPAAVAGGAAPPPRPGAAGGVAVSHAPDFASVRVGDQLYTFTPKQRLIVAALWRAKEQGHEYLSTETLLEAAESNGGKVRDIFRGSPAWGTLIVPAVAESGTVGTYRLAVELVA